MIRKNNIKLGNIIGYKVINVPYLIVLKFDKDTEFVNLHESKSRSNKAIVKDMIRLTNNETEIINYNYPDLLKYEIGKEISKWF